MWRRPAMCLLVAAAAGTACARQQAPQAAAVSISIPPLRTSDRDAGPKGPRGRAQLRARDMTSHPVVWNRSTVPQCQLDERISRGPGVLEFPRSGDGPVVATFAEQIYEGQVVKGHLELVARSELDWDDNCHWRTEQRIVGDLVVSGNHVDGVLAWAYKEEPVRPLADGVRCAGACVAEAAIDVEPEGAVDVEERFPQRPHED